MIPGIELPYFLNSAWMASCTREYGAFRAATHDVAETQRSLLRAILARNCNSDFGREQGFAAIRTIEEFRDRTAIHCYDDYQPLIERIAAGSPNLLTTDEVIALQPTGGSSGGEKLIPYTASLHRQYQRALSAWIYDLFSHRPAVRRGRAYWAISPVLPARRSDGGIKIGFAADSEYLNRWQRLAANRLLVMPDAIAKLADIQNFRYATLLFLLAADDLSLISIWSPSYLTALLEPLDRWWEQLCADLATGNISLPHHADAATVAQLQRRLAPRPMRARRLREIFAGRNSVAAQLRIIWPRLALISCWTEAAAADFVAELREQFPHVEVQPKGLLATEGVVSIPLIGRPGAALALRSHFFEFIDCENDATPLLAHELTQERRYRVLLTTGGGFYRYDLGDIVQVVGFEQQCPLLRFVGRGNNSVDLVGEKLNETHVSKVIDHALDAHGLTARFAMLTPTDERAPGYCLLMQLSERRQNLDQHSINATVEQGLAANPYYRHAVALGQLAPLRLVILPENIAAWDIYERKCLQRGQKLGDIKPLRLHRWNGWEQCFRESTTALGRGTQNCVHAY